MKKLLTACCIAIGLSISAQNAQDSANPVMENSKINTQEDKAPAENKSKLKKMRLYHFEFRFLPAFAAGVKISDDATELLSDTKYICGPRLAKEGFKIPFNYKDIKVDVFGEGESAYVVWTMPDPREIPLAKYLAFVPDAKSGRYAVYTLEKSLNWGGDESIAWVLGEASPDSHGNFGQVKYPETAADFAAIVAQIIARKSAPAATLE